MNWARMKDEVGVCRVRRLERTRFTLLELIVVIGVIGIMVGLMLPLLSKARARARGVACINNMKQMALGFTIYADDYDGVMVAGRMPKLSGSSSNDYFVGNGWKFRPRWYTQMGASLKHYPFNPPIPGSAADNTQRVDNPAYLCLEKPEMDNGRNYAFGYNFQFLGNSRFKTGTSQYINWPVKIHTVKRLATTVMFADAMGTAAGKPAAVRVGYDVALQNGGANVNAIGNHAWSLDPPHLSSVSDFCDDGNRSPVHRSAPDPRHLRRANVAFCDGRVEAMTLSALGYVISADGSVDITGSNEQFSGTGEDILPPTY